MMSLLLHNLRILDPFGDPGFIDSASILIENGRIKSVFEGSPSEGFTGANIDMGGKTVLPGMINTHTHLYSTLAMGMPAPKNSPKNFVEILKEIWWKLDRGLDKYSTQASFEAGLLDCIQNGITTVIDHHASPAFVEGSLDILVETAEKYGIKIGICFEISDRNGEANFKTELQENLRAMNVYRNHPNVLPLLGLHASFTLSDASLQTIKNSLKDHDEWGVHIHVAEDLADEKDAQSRGYESVIRRLDHFGLLNNRSLIIHGIFMSPGDRQILLEKSCMLIHNPTSNANNQVGILDTEIIEKLQAGLGTDGMQNNMLSEAKEGSLIRAANSMDSVDYLKLLFNNNPIIASRLFGTAVGHITTGNLADLVFYDYEPRTDIHVENYKNHILYGLGKPTDVMSQGIFRMRNGDIQDINVPAVLKNARTQSTRLWKAMGKL